MKRIALLLACCIPFASYAAMADDPSTSAIDNIGFIKNPPKELREKFPMCDAFLKVEWIDTEKRVGYSEYEFYNQGKKVHRIAHALVYLDSEHPVFDINMDEFRKKGKLTDTFDLIRRGEFEDQEPQLELTLDAERNGTNFEYTFSSILSDWDMPQMTLAENKLNVCIPYPGNQRMYFAEQKRLGMITSSGELERKLGELRKWIGELPPADTMYSLDVNFDGEEDYLSINSLIYSHNGRYYQMQFPWRESQDSANKKLTSPTNGKTCVYQTFWPDSYYLTTDGRNIFIDNQCSLTELTK
jgi:hypothetical protein